MYLQKKCLLIFLKLVDKNYDKLTTKNKIKELNKKQTKQEKSEEGEKRQKKTKNKREKA